MPAPTWPSSCGCSDASSRRTAAACSCSGSPREAAVKLVHSGKVRDVYADGDDLVMVASDRISVYDVVLPTPVPDKGAILTQLSLWWFERLPDGLPHHAISAGDL